MKFYRLYEYSCLVKCIEDFELPDGEGWPWLKGNVYGANRDDYGWDMETEVGDLGYCTDDDFDDYFELIEDENEIKEIIKSKYLTEDEVVINRRQ